MHLVIDNVAGDTEVDRVDDLVVTVVLVAVEIGRLTAVACRKREKS
jgi:hypothetical protein